MSTCNNECLLTKNNKNSFVRWLVEKIGPVLVGSKPAELLSFLSSDKDLSNKINLINNCIGRCKRIEFKVIELKNKNIKVLFFNINKLNDTLSDKRNYRFLTNEGYPKEYSFNDYMQILTNKITTGVIPHEIGLFLGYPLKDVIGFIGHPSLKLTKICGWRVYGNSKPSDIIYQDIVKAKNIIRDLLRFNDPEEVLLMSI